MTAEGERTVSRRHDHPSPGIRPAGLNLAAALSATVTVNTDGSVVVVRTGGPAQVLRTGALLPTSELVVRAGVTVTLAGFGFVAGTPVTLVLPGSPAAPLGTAVADSRGRLTARAVIPRGTSSGVNAIDAVDATGSSLLIRPTPIVVIR